MFSDNLYMQISTEHGFAFLCTPKCASTSIEETINEFCNINFSGHPKIKHINSKVFIESILLTHSKLVPSVKIESFCLIREPLEWIQSWYRYRARDELKNKTHPNHQNYTGSISYNEFILEFIYEGTRKPFANLDTQYDFMKTHKNHIGVDYIFPMNNIETVATFLSEKVGEQIYIPLKNISPKKLVTLDEGLEIRLRKYLEKDQIIYNFAKKNTKFDKALHSNKLFELLLDCPDTRCDINSEASLLNLN